MPLELNIVSLFGYTHFYPTMIAYGYKPGANKSGRFLWNVLAVKKTFFTWRMAVYTNWHRSCICPNSILAFWDAEYIGDAACTLGTP